MGMMRESRGPPALAFHAAGERRNDGNEVRVTSAFAQLK
jgi:hypothetical protein